MLRASYTADLAPELRQPPTVIKKLFAAATWRMWHWSTASLAIIPSS